MYSFKVFTISFAGIALWAFMTASVIAQFEGFARATAPRPAAVKHQVTDPELLARR